MHRVLLGLLLVVAATGPGFAQASNPLDPVGVVREEYITAQNRHDIDRMLSLLADQVEFRIGLSKATLASASENHAQLRTRFTRIAENLPKRAHRGARADSGWLRHHDQGAHHGVAGGWL